MLRGVGSQRGVDLLVYLRERKGKTDRKTLFQKESTALRAVNIGSSRRRRLSKVEMSSGGEGGGTFLPPGDYVVGVEGLWLG